MKSRILTRLLFVGIGALACADSAWAAGPEQTRTESEKIEFFERKIRPILADNCYNCHAADTKPAGGLRVDDRNGILTGGDNGPGVTPGDPDASLILKRIRHSDPKRRMPKDSDPLNETQIQDLVTWIKDGAAWPREKLPTTPGQPNQNYERLKATHWAWQPLTNPVPPSVAKKDWARNDVDRFILAKLEASKLEPVGDADPLTLIRRVAFDLTGLPPSPEQVDQFLQDPSPDAFARLVNRFLDSPRFGERWGRKWLDVARYGESTGPSRNIPYPHAWKYRDYVIDSINRDVPLDRFIQEQIAGDLLPAASNTERDRLLTATGFLALGVKDVNQRFKTRYVMDNVDEQIDTVTRSILGLTVSCARCHDHKFDPISTTDYYALAGIFTSTDDCAGLRNKMGGGGLDYYDPKHLLILTVSGPAADAEKVAKLTAEVAEAKKAWDGIRGTPEGLKVATNGFPTQRPYRLKYEKLQGELLELTDPAARGFAAHGVRESKAIADTEIRIRGVAERLGPTVPRGFLTAYAVPDAPRISDGESGRLQLAQWLTNPRNPFPPRVLANRVWAGLFGEGLVSTVDNFGIKGESPSHPELLDYLAHELIRDGWSLKGLIRTIVLSRAYQLGSEARPANREIDPGNRLVWRHAPRRLEAEEIRDAMLAAAGQLDLTPPKGSAARELKMIEMRDNGDEARGIHEKSDRGLSRSVYLPLLRGVVPKSLEVFDPVEQTLVTGKRENTTVPAQALYLLNSPFTRRQSLTLAERILADGRASDFERIQRVFLLTLGRAPDSAEISRALQFLAHYQSSYARLSPSELPKQEAAATAKTEEAKAPVNPDDIDRTDRLPAETSANPKDARNAAWMSFVQALFASAEFRFVR